MCRGSTLYSEQCTSRGVFFANTCRSLLRLYCIGLGFQANIVKKYVLLSALQHVFAGLKRTRDQKLSSGLMSCQLSSAVFWLMLLTFMTTHPFQLHFADIEQYFLRPPGLMSVTFMIIHLRHDATSWVRSKVFWYVGLCFLWRCTRKCWKHTCTERPTMERYLLCRRRASSLSCR